MNCLRRDGGYTTWLHGEGVCAEIEHRLPHILQGMADRLQVEHEVVTMDLVRQSFLDTLASERLTWVSNPQEQGYDRRGDCYAAITENW